MKLQLALDYISFKEAEEILFEVGDSVDIVEIGTPLLIREGIRVVNEMKNKFPHFEILADMKIVDNGEWNSMSAFSIGADLVTVLGIADNITIQYTIEQAKKFGKKIMMDMIGVENLPERARELDNIGADYICVHTARDLQSEGKTPQDELRMVKSILKNTMTAVAGGISLNNIMQIAALKPEIVIVGKGIINQRNRRQAALQIREIMNKQ